MKDNLITSNENENEQQLQLINFQDSKFIINEEALEFINSIKEEIIVVSVIGKARTGKSYLMNLLLDNNKINNGVRLCNNSSLMLILKFIHVPKEFGFGVISEKMNLKLRRYYLLVNYTILYNYFNL